MNIVIEAKDIVLVLVGVVGSVVASYIYRWLESSSTAAQALERDLASGDAALRARAVRLCLFASVRFFIFANIFCVVSGVAWVFGTTHYDATLAVLGAASFIAILLFWIALRWLVRAQKGSAD